jgi:hypothetical protein
MMGLVPRGNRFRAIALLSGAALALHQLRYLLAYGGHSGEQLTLQAHAYVAVLLPFVAALVLVAVVAFLVDLLAARGTRTAEPGLPSGRKLWVCSSGVLLGVYGFQEWLEGQLGQGHEAGLGAIFAHGGCWAIPLALVLGALVSWLLKGAAGAIELVATRRPSGRRLSGSVRRGQQARPAQKPALDVVASFLAGRGPPVPSN